jgi:hypothetical protein
VSNFSHRGMFLYRCVDICGRHVRAGCVGIQLSCVQEAEPAAGRTSSTAHESSITDVRKLSRTQSAHERQVRICERLQDAPLKKCSMRNSCTLRLQTWPRLWPNRAVAEWALIFFVIGMLRFRSVPGTCCDRVRQGAVIAPLMVNAAQDNPMCLLHVQQTLISQKLKDSHLLCVVSIHVSYIRACLTTCP